MRVLAVLAAVCLAGGVAWTAQAHDGEGECKMPTVIIPTPLASKTSDPTTTPIVASPTTQRRERRRTKTPTATAEATQTPVVVTATPTEPPILPPETGNAGWKDRCR